MVWKRNFGLGNPDKFYPNHQLIPLSVIPLSGTHCLIKNLIWEFIAGLVFLRNDFQEAFNDAKAKSKLSTALKTAAEQRVLI
jgi:hypothetical protein